jgi:hypothetical protein
VTDSALLADSLESLVRRPGVSRPPPVAGQWTVNVPVIPAWRCPGTVQ